MASSTVVNGNNLSVGTNDAENLPIFKFLKVVKAPADYNVPGNLPIWVGIFAEMFEFALCFAIYFVAKLHYPELFNQGPLQLHTIAGTINTLVLITSSYCVARAMVAIRQNRPQTSVHWLYGTLFCGCLYIVIKLLEYRWNWQQGIFTNTNEFFSVYYYITFNHFIHVAWGSCAIFWLILRLKSDAYSSDDFEGMEAIACYWHMIDLVWIIIFPLLYAFR